MSGRREQILTVAAQLFAKHGFHGVSIADLGAAVGISGPALYRHFPGKDALLEEMLVGISEYLLAGGEKIAAEVADPAERLRELIDFHARFATRKPELIIVQDRDLANLNPTARAKVRKLQRTYVEIWVDVLRSIRPELDDAQRRVAAHGAFGLLNSTPHAGRTAAAAEVLKRMALAALHAA
ncbi:transcriptional regulator, TetR family [Pseudonocardia thermophila]|jgi:Transcriptional regulator|uniref:Transcriptional regulator, TetR family n=1 Tax=Pseudonocardia thermophila TaxID=1848 RepID=A0A1M6UKD0_PSETH|nr:TetR/AcrR family transcriptional regulator [Pseudonocardia thermophila]SHK69590.1 transcriptional regulator, TetR family [Pseudonocardia thermophila]